MSVEPRCHVSVVKMGAVHVTDGDYTLDIMLMIGVGLSVQWLMLTLSRYFEFRVAGVRVWVWE